MNTRTSNNLSLSATLSKLCTFRKRSMHLRRRTRRWPPSWDVCTRSWWTGVWGRGRPAPPWWCCSSPPPSSSSPASGTRRTRRTRSTSSPRSRCLPCQANRGPCCSSRALSAARTTLRTWRTSKSWNLRRRRWWRWSWRRAARRPTRTTTTRSSTSTSIPWRQSRAPPGLRRTPRRWWVGNLLSGLIILGVASFLEHASATTFTEHIAPLSSS